MWVLGTEPGSSARAVSALNPPFFFFDKTFLPFWEWVGFFETGFLYIALAVLELAL